MHDIAKVHDIAWYSEVPRSIRTHTVFGLVLLVVCFGGFGGWAVTAPLAAAIISQGKFVATGQNKVVQHLEGGIIKAILVNEGDQVEVDQPLILLDETAAKVRERQLFLRQARLELIAARLTAQIRGSAAIELTDLVRQNLEDPEIAPMFESQKLIFEAFETRLRNETALLMQNIEAYKFRISGYRKQLESMQLQLQLLREELAGKQELLKMGLTRSTEVKAIQRAIAEATGQSGWLSGEISETTAQIIKEQRQIRQAEDVQRQASLEELESIQSELDAVREQSREAKNVLQRATINAPVAGTVIRLFYHTAGGVIESGKGIMEILPADVPLIIEAQVKRTEVDSVRVGEEASIRLVALNQRTTPVLTGKVFYLSADALPQANSTTTQDFYLARISLPGSELARIRGRFTPTPGMPVEVLIKTEERTFFDYLTRPIVDSMSRAFTEQ